MSINLLNKLVNIILMRVLVIVVFFAVTLSCNNNLTCKDSQFLIGRYKLQTDLLISYNNNDSSILPLAKENNWDKIELIVGIKSFHFETNKEYFRKYEGTWEYKSIGFDGDCYVYIHQKEGTREIPQDPFNIAITFNGKMIILPFKKN